LLMTTPNLICPTLSATIFNSLLSLPLNDTACTQIKQTIQTIVYQGPGKPIADEKRTEYQWVTPYIAPA